MLAWPMPPGTVPTSTFANRNIFRVTPPVFIRLPIRMKKGAAIMVKELEAWVMRCTTTMGGVPVRKMYRKDVRPRLTYRGSPVKSRTTNTTKTIIIASLIPHPLLFLYSPAGPW